MLTYEDFVAFSGKADDSLAAPDCRGNEAVATLPPDNHCSPLRSYPADTAEAQARLVALALLADGQMDPREIAVLCRDQGLGSLGLSTRDFFQVLYDFCADVSRMPAVGGIYNISPKGLTRLLAEVGDPVLRQRTFELMLDVASADGKLDRGEAALLSNVMDAWQVRGPECGPHGARRSRHRGARAAVRHATASA